MSVVAVIRPGGEQDSDAEPAHDPGVDRQVAEHRFGEAVEGGEDGGGDQQAAADDRAPGASIGAPNLAA